MLGGSRRHSEGRGTIIRTFCVLFQLKKKTIYNICMFSISL